MWYVEGIDYLGKTSASVSLDEDFPVWIRNINDNRCKYGHYYEFECLNVIGCIVDKEKNEFKAGVVNPLGLKLIDFIEDISIVKSIPRSDIRISYDIIPISDLYCRENIIFNLKKSKPCVFITDIIYDAVLNSTLSDNSIKQIKEKNRFYIDCYNCANKYKVTLKKGFWTQVSKLAVLYKNQKSR